MYHFYDFKNHNIATLTKKARLGGFKNLCVSKVAEVGASSGEKRRSRGMHCRAAPQ